MGVRFATTALLVASAFVELPALANGRYPSAQQLLVAPGEPARMWLRATYGLVASTDGGQNWDWVCEDSVGYDAREDPTVAIAHEGRVFAGASSGLFVTSDGGCSWPRNESMGNTYVRDLATDAGGTEVVAITSVAQRNGDYELKLWRSSDDPPAFAEVGPPLSRDVLGFTVDVAPSDSKRLYVSGAVWPLSPAAGDAGAQSLLDGSPRGPNGPAIFFRSTDGGATWTRRRLAGASLYNTPYIAAVDPTNADVVYVRVRGVSQEVGTITSLLLYSEDGGDSFREIFRGSADMLGFAVTPDGKHVYVGLGDSRDSQRQVDEEALGIYESSAPDFSFSRVFTGQIGCLAYSGNALYACGTHVSTGFELGRSEDAGRTFQPLLDFGGIRGPLECAPGSPTAVNCVPAWPVVCDPVGVCPQPGGSVDAGISPATPKKDDSGCAVSEAASDDAPWTVVSAVTGAVALAFARKRARNRRQSWITSRTTKK